MRLDRKTQLSIAYAILTILLLLVMQSYFEGQVDSVKYSDFRQWVVEGRVAEANVGTDDISGKYYADGVGEGGLRTFSVNKMEDPGLVELLQTHVPDYNGKREPTWLTSLLGWILPAVFFVGIWMFMARRMSGGSGGLMSIGKSKAKVYMEKGTGITFEDVAGIDEAKEELEEIVEFLRTPERFQALGGKIPRGVLLVGSPGTGKTLLAKAVAGEAGVPFFSISGSDFVEMFVGVGAARVRDLFEQAKKHAPAIIFIDELDALGKARGAGSFGGHDEREQTLNQLLTELDGFEVNAGVILMAATNRPEVLDPALLRPGRFDRTVTVDRPDVKGREAILRIHSKEVKLAGDVDLHRMAVRTPGFAGADLANIINEAALLAARRNKDAITMEELSEAVERAVAGLERKSRVLNEKERRIVAYHEAGHAIVGEIVDETNPVQKISIIPRGVGALGYTLNSPVEDRYLMTKTELLGRICGLLGGRAAEDLVFSEKSTGAANDLMRATQLAESMVKEYGMSETLGLVAHREDRNQTQFLGMGGSDRDYSEETARRIDEEVAGIINGSYAQALELLTERRDTVEQVVEILFEKEIMEGEELRRLLGKAPADGDLTHVSGNGSSDPDDDVSGAGSDAAT
ncbi:MAG TPA: ATP-dependent zinc metalloprotease FtsH [Candidatus Latescibacteria bacterium]|jgi:cell division protease FtsH|nr:cell division protein FtsH [Gemmatimonadaceae bacterium]MDP6018244.1 ATP-dependent zinc metalloprotease FtsH [Candidatus Latescibacterota bacterium]HJP30749.1 ATP-dependent zinc metalloprotease FtsH [Candidatus Latescibacterota bacterium]